MLMHSLRQFRLRGVTAGTIRTQFLMPNGQAWWLDVVILGVNRVARAGKHEQLGWPPQTVFAEYGPAFAKGSGSLAYAKPLSLRGHLVSVNLITSSADDEFATRLQQQEVAAEVQFFRQWAKTRDHPQCADWPQQLRQLEQNINAFSNHKLSFYQLLQQFIRHFDQGSRHQAERTQTLADRAAKIHKHYVDERNARLPVAILVINVNHVEHYNYGDDRDIRFNTEKEDAEHRKTGDLLRVMFTRVKQQKAQFEREDLPFYDQNWLATQQARDQPIWYPEQLDAFHLKL